jgi:D-3-phosphoglycerate dehydrogenase
MVNQNDARRLRSRATPDRAPADGPSEHGATPHVAFYSEESIAELQLGATENVVAVLTGQTPASVVNPSVLGQGR